jgi:two-component system response regulator HupR/HoxA
MAAARADYKAYPLLFVDDEPDIIETFRFNYENDFTVLAATCGSEALRIVERQPVAVLIADQRMPEMSGLDVIRRALELRPDLIPIILTGYTDVETLVTAINLGRIYRYIPKPWDGQELRMALTRAVEAFHLARENVRLLEENARLLAELQRTNEHLALENRYLKQRDARDGGFAAVIGRSDTLRRALDTARRVLDSPTTVLIEGPTGTGKEMVAKAIHYEGSRRDRLFVAVNCGALSEALLASELFGHRKGAFTGAVADKKGLFETADGGTLFLDEIGDTSPAVQVHLLRVLQEGEMRPVGATRAVRVDVRIIAATNRDLVAEVERGRFREDLYFRLSVFRIRLPGLKDRREDIPLLVEHFVQKYSRVLKRPEASVTPEALTALMHHDYRGNVRELENTIERAMLLSEPGHAIGIEHVLAEQPGTDCRGATLHDEVHRYERERIARALELCGGNKSRAARQLGLTYRGLLKKMQRFGMPTGSAAAD